jgi:uncharacterized protein YyaL (SSP411 family)
MNRLSKESSPYLLQHAHNPVDWYPWGAEALQKAKAEDKPILVSIGYSACHWCHVMERESFEDESTARMMNEHFVNIKIDREERPDLDHIYMDAVQAMTGAGGWPLNVFLTPEGKPFYGGTYFPPVRAYNRASWKEVMLGLAKAFQENRSQIEEQADQLTGHLKQANSFGTSPASIHIPFEERFTRTQLDHAFQQVMGQADKTWGGFGKMPKFPQTFTIQFLLRYHFITGNRDALDQALLSLDKMIMGGIYDHIGGGFARYSTDTEWLAPHFEKMLYDNALLVLVLCEAWQLTGETRYEKVIRETLRFIEGELMSPEFGFYSALDADSEGVEGKYYVWAKQEVIDILGSAGIVPNGQSGAGWNGKPVCDSDIEVFCNTYDISDQGNWEHTSIPRLKTWPSAEHAEMLEACRVKLAMARTDRVKPGLDDKILLSWNALMNQAFSKAAAVFADNHYRDIAVKNMDFMLGRMSGAAPGRMKHTYKEGVARVDAFLDDLAYLIRAQISLQELTGETGYLTNARVLIEEAMAHFNDEEGLFFFFTRDDQEDTLVRKKEIYDGATPSGNAIMANCLLHMSILFERNDWKDRAVGMADAVNQMAVRYPTSFGVWTNLIQELVYGTLELVVTGQDAGAARCKVLKPFIPYKVFMSSETGNEDFPLLRGKKSNILTSFYLCKNYSCQNPVNDSTQFIQLIEKELSTKYELAQ